MSVLGAFCPPVSNGFYDFTFTRVRRPSMSIKRLGPAYVSVSVVSGSVVSGPWFLWDLMTRLMMPKT